MGLCIFKSIRLTEKILLTTYGLAENVSFTPCWEDYIKLRIDQEGWIYIGS